MLSRASRLWRVKASYPAPCRLRRDAAVPPTLRYYSDSHGPASTPAPQSAIIIPHDAQNITPDELIQHIQPPERGALNGSLVFLLTPSFARWLSDDHTFLQKAVDRVLTHHRRTHIAAIAAVVDKLPARYQKSELSQKAEYEAEGIAYTFLAKPISNLRSSESALNGNGISFHHTFSPRGLEQDLGRQYHYSNILRLPLANTIFQTGSPSTMVHSIWLKGNLSNKAKLNEWNSLSHCGLQIHESARGSKKTYGLDVPLIPLSFPRIVEAGMGNIVRKIVGENKTSITASAELEEIIPRYFKSRGEPARAISVWALVIPENVLDSVINGTRSMLPGKDTKSWEALWKENSPQRQSFISSAIAEGARLHRVLSGGGGWGKKAGLLALDPEMTYDEDILAFPSVYGDSTAISPGEFGSAHEFVRPGDSIQFFTLSSPSDFLESTITTAPGSTSRGCDWEFGTVPSTIDSIQSVSSPLSESESSDLTVLPNRFGALTEGALTMVKRRQDVSNPENSWETVNATKIDVPHTRFVGTELETILRPIHVRRIVPNKESAMPVVMEVSKPPRRIRSYTPRQIRKYLANMRPKIRPIRAPLIRKQLLDVHPRIRPILSTSKLPLEVEEVNADDGKYHTTMQNSTAEFASLVSKLRQSQPETTSTSKIRKHYTLDKVEMVPKQIFPRIIPIPLDPQEETTVLSPPLKATQEYQSRAVICKERGEQRKRAKKAGKPLTKKQLKYEQKKETRREREQEKRLKDSLAVDEKVRWFMDRPLRVKKIPTELGVKGQEPFEGEEKDPYAGTPFAKERMEDERKKRGKKGKRPRVREGKKKLLEEVSSWLK
ncbi:hypothetical protein GQ43DRAFT_482441 [Delitschia confertaspora ATCC 74209]|uniref:Uncharacterized protein n=1 Tax=Delitschia confertaspora ATCC 74209 TaxID=1513339 RepID=A0A9P4MNG8_9PLEO|nr:hypothetical protein GQ43DRAFT_482441 [Delitschia confertaspora ATCC 74209]